MNYFPWSWYVEYWFFVRMAIFRQNGKFRETKAAITLDLKEILLSHFILQLPLRYGYTSTTVEVWKYFNYSWSMNCHFHEIFNFLNSYFNYSWSIWYTSPSGRVSIKYSSRVRVKITSPRGHKVKNTFPSGRRPQGKVFLWPWRPQGEVILTLTRESILYLPNRLVRYSILVLFISRSNLREINIF